MKKRIFFFLLIMTLLLGRFAFPTGVHAANNSNIVFLEDFESAKVGHKLSGWSGNFSIQKDGELKALYTSPRITPRYICTPYVNVDTNADYAAIFNMKLTLTSGRLTLRYACYDSEKKGIYAKQYFFKNIIDSYNSYTDINFYLPIHKINPKTRFIRLCLWWNNRAKGDAFINSIKLIKLMEKKYLKEYSKNSGDWFKFCLGQKEIPKDSILNCSCLLPKPAGKKGFVVAKNRHFYFENGERARFWGTTVGYEAAYLTHREAQRVAHYLAANGINLVRLLPTKLFQSDSHRVDLRKWDRLCYFINALKKEGIYIYLYSVTQVHYSRPEKFIHNGKKSKALAFFYKPFKVELKEFWRKILTKVNPYTNKALKDDPVLAFFVMINEASLYNELIYHFDYLTKDQQEEVLHVIHQYDPSISSPTKKDPKLYYACYMIESKFYKQMYSFLRTILPKIPIAGTNTCFNPLMVKSYSENTDFVGNHWYGPYARHNEGLVNNHNILEDNIFAGSTGALDEIIGLRLEGKPFILGEWNIGFPVDYRHVGPLFICTYACFQDFDAAVLFLYFKTVAKNKCWIPSTLISGHDPSRAGIFPAASTIFHRRYVSEGKEKVILNLPADLSENTGKWSINKIGSDFQFIPYLHQISLSFEKIEKSAHKCVIGSNGSAVKLVAEAKKNAYLNFESHKILTDTNEVQSDFKNGILKINTPKAQGAIGNLPKEENIELSDAIIENVSDQCSLIVTSMDNKDIIRSNRLLITFVGDSMNQGDKYLLDNIPDPNERPRYYYFERNKLGNSPTLVKPLSAELRLRRIDPSTSLNIYTLGSNGVRKKALTYEKMGNWYYFHLDTGGDKTIYYEIGQVH